MPAVPGLLSPYEKVGRLVYFGRMIDKIRLHAQGRLPAEYVANLGFAFAKTFDTRCCNFLGVGYEPLVARVKQGDTDEELLAWCHANGTARSDEDCEVWNGFMAKRGWRDDSSERLQQRVAEYGLAGRGIETFFDMFEHDEGRV